MEKKLGEGVCGWCTWIVWIVWIVCRLYVMLVWLPGTVSGMRQRMYACTVREVHEEARKKNKRVKLGVVKLGQEWFGGAP